MREARLRGCVSLPGARGDASSLLLYASGRGRSVHALTLARAVRLLGLLALVVVCLLPARARADRVPVIEGGREADVLALFEPYRLMGPVTDDWTLRSVQIDSTRIKLQLLRGTGEVAHLALDHPSREPDAARSESFALVRGDGAELPGADAALGALIAAVQANDHGGFWKIERPVSRAATELAKASSLSLEAGMSAWDWISDGLVRLFLIASILGGLAVYLLRERPRRDAWILVAVLIASFALRVLLVEPHYLGVWPYTRFGPTALRVYEGPGLATLGEWLGGTYTMVEVGFANNLAYGALAPLAVYVHASYLLKDGRAALASAALIALLPSHIRFTASEVMFIPSIVMSSFTFALLHIALVERSRLMRWPALFGLAVSVAMMVTIRPLNVLFLALFVGVALYLRAEATPRLRRFGVVAVMLVVGVSAAVSYLRSHHADQVAEGLSLEVIGNALALLVDFRLNALLNPWITPTLMFAVAVTGAVVTWKHNRRLAVILIGWMAVFHVGHAYVVAREPAMQARYYLHLAVPLVMLTGLGAVWLWDTRRRLAQGFAVYALLCPAIHYGFIVDYDFLDVREYEFVREQAAAIPEDCVVLEYFNHRGDEGSIRFDRMASYIEDGVRRKRYRSQAIGARLDGGFPAASGRTPAELIREDVQTLIDERAAAGECLYYYVGVPCWGNRPAADESPLAPACEAVLQRVGVEVVAEARVRYRPYDWTVVESAADDLRELRLSLYRIHESRGFSGRGGGS